MNGKRSHVALGLDFGTESVRAMLVNIANGRVAGEAVVGYRHGVITETLPGSSRRLPSEWALQDPQDYLDSMERATRRALRNAHVESQRVCGIGVSFTACTMLPTRAGGSPLCRERTFARRRNAWCKLWKHHAAQPQAERITDLARQRGVAWLERYGGVISSEWFLPKALQTLEEEPDVWRAADVFIEAGEWIVWQLTGVLTRSTCHGGYKQCWHDRGAYPSQAMLTALHPQFGQLTRVKMRGPRFAPGQCAGRLTSAMADRLGLGAGIPVSASIIDAHGAVPGAGVTGPDVMVMVMGTSTCHMLMATRERLVKGISGVVRDGILPGYFGYEAGQVAVGDIFAWYVRHVAGTRAEADKLHARLTRQAATLEPGESGLLALDWWNGNRTPYVDANLSGLIVGLTLATKPPEVYRALIESTAFGTMRIIELLERAGVSIKALVACGGIANKNPLLMQIYADVTGRPIRVASSDQASCLGAAMLGALASGVESVDAMVRPPRESYRPHQEAHVVYGQLYAEYKRLSERFGRYRDPAMRSLRQIAAGTTGKR